MAQLLRKMNLAEIFSEARSGTIAHNNQKQITAGTQSTYRSTSLQGAFGSTGLSYTLLLLFIHHYTVKMSRCHRLMEGGRMPAPPSPRPVSPPLLPLGTSKRAALSSESTPDLNRCLCRSSRQDLSHTNVVDLPLLFCGERRRLRGMNSQQRCGRLKGNDVANNLPLAALYCMLQYL